MEMFWKVFYYAISETLLLTLIYLISWFCAPFVTPWPLLPERLFYSPAAAYGNLFDFFWKRPRIFWSWEGEGFWVFFPNFLNILIILRIGKYGRISSGCEFFNRFPF